MPDLRSPVAVFVGGALGTLARVTMTSGIDDLGGLFAVNGLGCLVLGVLLGAMPATTPAWVRHGLGAGVLGGFTTYSAVALLSASAILAGGLFVGLGVSLAMLVGGLAAAWAGLHLGRVLSRRTDSSHDAGSEEAAP